MDYKAELEHLRYVVERLHGLQVNRVVEAAGRNAFTYAEARGEMMAYASVLGFIDCLLDGIPLPRPTKGA